MVQTINNRDIQRNFKHWREQLLTGEAEELLIPQKDGRQIKITVVSTSNETSAQRFIRHCRENPLKDLKRPNEDLF